MNIRIVFLSVCVVISVTTLIGIFSTHCSAIEQQDISDYSKVEIQNLLPSNEIIHMDYLGIVKTDDIIKIGAESSGRIEKIHVQEGENVKKQSLLLTLNAKGLAEKVRAAALDLKAKTAEYDSIVKSYSTGGSSYTQVTNAKHLLENARTNLLLSQESLDNSSILSHYDGYIEKIFFKAGELLKVGDTVIQLIKSNPQYYVSTFVSQIDAQKIKMNNKLMISNIHNINVSNDPCTIINISKTANTYNKKYEVKIECNYPNDNSIMIGEMVNVHIPTSYNHVYKIPMSSLSMNDAGELGIKVMNNNNIVEFYYIDSFKENDGYALITARDLPSSLALITKGHGMVNIGMHIKS